MSRKPRVLVRRETPTNPAPAASARMTAIGARERTRELLGRVSPDTWGLLAVVAAVLVAHGPYILGILNPNPLGPQSWLLTSFSSPPFPGLPTIDPASGTVSQALGHRAVLDVLHLHVPWWNPYEATGVPLAGEMQSAALFPLTILTLFSNGQLWEHMLLELIAGASTFLLLRRLSVGVWASSAAGIAFALNGTFSWFANPVVNAAAFLPPLLLGLEMACSASTRNVRGGWWLIPIAGALMFYGGFPEVMFIDVLMAFVWFAWRCWTLRADTIAIRAFALKSVAGAVVALLLIAPLLIAFVDYLNHALTAAHNTSLTGARINQLGLPQLLLPYVYGPIIGYFDPHDVVGVIWTQVGGYLSTSLVLFAMLGALSRRHFGLRVLLVVWVLAGLSHTYGLPPLIGRVFDVVPGMSRVAFFRYGTSSIELAVIILAGLGFDDLISKRVRPRRLIITTGVALALVAIAAVAAEPLVHQLGATNAHSSFSTGSVLWGAGIVIVIATVAVLVRRPGIRAGALAGVLALDMIVLFMAAELSAGRNFKIDLAPVSYLRQHLGTSRYFTLRPLAADYGSYFGIASLNSSDNPMSTLFSHYVARRLNPTVNAAAFWGTQSGSEQELVKNISAYRAAGVAYVLAPPGQALPQSAGFTLVLQTASTWIYRLSGSQPYFTARGCLLRTQSRTDVSLLCSRATTLVRRETYMPGWSAQLDGRTKPISTVDDIFQGVKVGPGFHRVTFGFTPPGETFGLIAFVCGLVCLVAVPAGIRFRGSRVGV